MLVYMVQHDRVHTPDSVQPRHTRTRMAKERVSELLGDDILNG
jgi:hypothetical protein